MLRIFNVAISVSPHHACLILDLILISIVNGKVENVCRNFKFDCISRERRALLRNKAEAFDPAAGRIRLYIHGARVNKAYNRCLFTQLPVNKHLFTRQSVDSGQFTRHPCK